MFAKDQGEQKERDGRNRIKPPQSSTLSSVTGWRVEGNKKEDHYDPCRSLIGKSIGVSGGKRIE